MTKLIRIDRAGAADAEALALAGAATFLETFAGTLDGDALVRHCTAAHSAAAYRALLAAPDSALWLARAAEGGAPIGILVLCPPDLPAGLTQAGDLEVKRIYLLSRWHGGGHGSALMRTAIDHARGRGAPRLLLGVYRGNARALAFYAREGFEPVGERRFTVGGLGYDDLVLARPL